MGTLPQDWYDEKHYVFWYDDKVRFSDIDAVGHVNNNAYGVYFESARVNFLQQISPEFWKQQHYVVLAHLAIDYAKELTYPGTFRVGIRVENVGNTSFTVSTAIFGPTGTCHAVAKTVAVFVDRATQKPTPHAPALRKALEAYK